MASKSRFTATDVKAMVRDIRSTVLGQRVANVYNLGDKTYLFKFAIPGKSEKIVMLLESGVRFHTTKFARDKNDMPSPFAMKLRKFIRTRRLEDVRQLGSDRVVDFKFGSGDSVCHIILELYASGNIVLTDGSYEIQALLRSHQFEDDIAVKMHEIYPIAFTTSMDTPSASGDTNTAEEAVTTTSVLSMTPDEFTQWAQLREQQQMEMQQAHEEQQAIEREKKEMSGGSKSGGHQQGKKGGGGSKKNKPRKMTLRQLLLSKESGIASYGPEIIDHCLLAAQLTPSMKVSDLIVSDSSQESVAHLLTELQNGSQLLSLLDAPGQPGYVLYRSRAADKSLVSSNSSAEGKEEDELLKKSTGAADAAANSMEEYFDFVPRLFKQHTGTLSKEFPSFDEAVDDYYCKMEEQKMQHHAISAEETAKKKVNKVRSEMESQLKGFVDQQEKNLLHASLVEMHSDDVDKVCMVINSALGAGLSWDDIAAMVATETAAGNPIASLVSKLKLDKNKVVLRLRSFDEDEDNESESDSSDDESLVKKPVKAKKNATFEEIEIDLSLTAHANANRLYTQKKVAKVKEEKTAMATERAVKAVEEQTRKQLESQKIKRNLQAVRKVHWFEKFNWFVTSEGYLVLSGRDAQQNEALVKRYLRPGDAYVHADMHGASSCIVRCKTDEEFKPIPISPFALQEAGTMTICRSNAWAVKVVTSAWWVHSTQVSKTAPSGEYLTTGSFMIYGKKNFLPPTSLEMGFGILFRLDDSSVTRHTGERKDKSVEFDNESEDARSMMSERYNIEMEAVADPSLAIVAAANGVSGAASGGADSAVNQSAQAPAPKQSAHERRLAKKAAKKKGSGLPGSSDTPLQNIEEERPEDEDCESSDEGAPEEINITTDDGNPKSAGTPPIPTSGKEQQRKQQKKKTQQSVTHGNKDSGGRIAPGGKEKAVEAPPAVQRKKKAPNKKKARRYAHQDEEDLELAMQALGHSKKGGGGGTMSELQQQEAEEAKRAEKQRKQEKAGVHMLETDWEASLGQLDDVVRIKLEEFVTQGLLKNGEIDTFEISTLASFEASHGLKILELFTEDGKLERIGNKSGFLAGIMRRYSKELSAAENSHMSSDNNKKESDDLTAITAEDGDEDNSIAGRESRRDRKKKEQQEILAILEEEGVLDEMEGKQADELEKLTGNPTNEDTLLYAVPMCGPYSSMQNMKYRVKLTPGTGKKGKTAKNAVEVFMNSKDCSQEEKSLIKGLTDPEMVAIMIGDVKLSVPGLFSTLKNKKNEKKKASKAKKK